MSDELEVAGRVLQELEPAVRDFAARVTGSATHELGELLAGKVRLRRFRSEVKLWIEAKKIAEEAGLPVSAVPVKVLTPLLAYAALEDDDDMVGRWANLLANAATGSPAEVPPSFPDILRQLEPLDAKILDLLHEDAGRLVAGEEHDELPAGTITQARLENLVRLGVAFHPVGASGMLGGTPTVDRNAIRLSALGADFVRACQPPQGETSTTSG